MIKQFTIGKQTPPQQRLIVSGGELVKSDLDLLRVAVMNTGKDAEVDLLTEYGLWTFIVSSGNLGSGAEVFTLVSSGPPR